MFVWSPFDFEHATFGLSNIISGIVWLKFTLDIKTIQDRHISQFYHHVDVENISGPKCMPRGIEEVAVVDFHGHMAL